MKDNTQVASILRYPRLDTVLMVEKFIKENEDELTLTELWKNLPKKVMYQTFKVIIEYLIDSGKIMIHEKKVIWIYDPDAIKKLKNEELIIK